VNDHLEPRRGAISAIQLLAAEEDEGPVGLPLAVRSGHLDVFAGIDENSFQDALETLQQNRPPLTTEDALAAVLRRFGVRAKTIPTHADIVAWHEKGWQLMEVHAGALHRSRPI
jgi:hypothetical protein